MDAKLIEVVLTSAVVSAIVTGVFGPIIVFVLQSREERRQRSFDVRFQEYRRYVQALEDMSAAWTERAVRLLKVTQSSFDAIIDKSGEPEGHLHAINQSLGGMSADLFASFGKVKTQLTGLRLVCSDPLLTCVDQFVAMYDRLAGQLVAYVDSYASGVPSTVSLGDLVEMGKKADDLKRQIVTLMRKELKVD